MKKIAPFVLASLLALVVSAPNAFALTGGSTSGVGDGGSCTANWQCASGACANGTCAVVRTSGSTGTSGSNGTQSGLPDGSSCTASFQCATSACTNGVCGGSSAGSTGGSGFGCQSSSDCAVGQSCVNGSCVAGSGSGTGGSGSSCQSDSDCGFGESCVSGACQSVNGGGGGGSPSGGSGFPTPNPAIAGQYLTGAIAFINGLLVPLLIAIAFIVFLWGVANAYILHPDDETKRKQGHQYILWGVIGFVIIFSLWGIVNLVGDTFGLNDVGRPTYPTL